MIYILADSLAAVQRFAKIYDIPEPHLYFVTREDQYRGVASALFIFLEGWDRRNFSIQQKAKVLLYVNTHGNHKLCTHETPENEGEARRVQMVVSKYLKKIPAEDMDKKEFSHLPPFKANGAVISSSLVNTAEIEAKKAIRRSIAVAAMQAWIGNDKHGSLHDSDLAERSFRIADAMLKYEESHA